jgi:hypothetical protein
VGVKSWIAAASVVRQPVVSKPAIGAIPLRPSSSASRNASCDVPNTEMMPSPRTPIDRCM